jgi:GNAT superfamily N-acetyltransferase
MKGTETKTTGLKVRLAQPGDEGLILQLIKELAEYENLLNQVEATEAQVYKTLFETKYAEVLIGEYQNKPVSYALFFHNYSTFLAKPGIYLEDLYVRPEYRHMSFGKVMIASVAKLAIERDCGRMEWSCLNWNEPSLKFYKQLGAVTMDEWMTHRVTGDALVNLADLSNERKID